METYRLPFGFIFAIMSPMGDHIRLPDELGHQLQERRKALQLSKRELVKRSGKSRKVIDHLEFGQEATVSSLLAVLGALGLALTVEPVGLPTAEEVASRFAQDDDAA